MGDDIKRVLYHIRNMLFKDPSKSKSDTLVAYLSVGKHTYGEEHILIRNRSDGAFVKIGNFCSIADEISIFLGGNHRTDWVTTFPFSEFVDNWPRAKDIKGHPASNGSVIIGNDVWIGSHATIMSGITVGDGAVIGAHSVVTKNVLPYSIVAGNPAIHRKFRFKEDEIRKLLEIQWWNWSDQKISRHLHTLASPNLSNLFKGTAKDKSS